MGGLLLELIFVQFLVKVLNYVFILLIYLYEILFEIIDNFSNYSVAFFGISTTSISLYSALKMFREVILSFFFMFRVSVLWFAHLLWWISLWVLQGILLIEQPLLEPSVPSATTKDP